ncbi:MAG: AMP-binding protein, partial [Actinomycetota bacterium]|nr:AMP-binding protein [Actinomycetota bacterium]
MAVRNRISHWEPEPGECELWDLTVSGLLDRAAGLWPQREALVYSVYLDEGLDVRWSFAELRERSRMVGRAMIASGISPGEAVGVWATNLPQWLTLQFGAAYAGVVLVPMNPLYRGSEVRYVLSHSGAVACFVEPENRGVSLWNVLGEEMSDLSDCRLRVAIGDAPDDGGPSWDQWLETGHGISEDELDARSGQFGPDDVNQIQFTSGTTGFPKGVELIHRGIVNNARLYAERAQYPDGGRHCSPMPLFHCGGCVLSSLATVATGSTLLPMLTFDPDRMIRTLEDERCTSTTGVPTMLIALEEAADRAGAKLEHLQIVATGGSSVPVEVERPWIEKFGVRFTITYGLTEASPVITQSSPDDPEHLQIATCGIPLPGVEVDVVEPGTTSRVELGVQGEIRARGWLITRGYWNNEEATSAAIDPDGFLRTGDLGSMDRDGYLSITGRAKEMIIRGGENLDPAEIESAIRQLPGVIDAAVVGAPSRKYGEEVA